MRDDFVSREKVMDCIVKEYNRKRTNDGLKLAWIEKAVNEAPGIDEDCLFPISKEEVSKAGFEGRELRFRLFNGRLFAIRELAQ